MKRFVLFFAAFLLALNASQASPPPDGPIQKEIPNDTLLEQKIFVPYKNLKEVLDKKEQGVFIPYSDFLKLWEEATKKPPVKEIAPPPMDAAIIHATYKGEVHDEIVEFHGELKISAIKDKWAKLILKFDNVALTGASLNDQPPLMSPKDNGLELVMPEKGEYTLKVDFSTRVQSLPGKKTINFNLPSSPLTKLDITMPGTDLDIKIEPMLSQKTSVSNGKTEFSAFIASSGSVSIGWLVKSEETTAKSLIFSKSVSELSIMEAVYSLRTAFHLSIIQAKTDTLELKIPKLLNLVSVEGNNIKEWALGDDGILKVTLYEKISGDYLLKIRTEKFRNPDEANFDFPAIEVRDALRQEGMIAVEGEASLKIKVAKSGQLTQIDSAEISNQLSIKNPIYVFKFFRLPFELGFDILKIRPKITASQKIVVSFSETLIDYATRIEYQIKDAGIFELNLLIPEGFRVVEAGTNESVETFSLNTENNKNILKIILKNKAFGSFVIPVRLEADKEDKNFSLECPKLFCLDAEKEEGVIAFALKKNLKLSTQNIKALRPVSIEELIGMGFSPVDQLREYAAGYKYTTVEYECKMDIEKRSTKVMALVERTVSIEETSVKYSDRIQYTILYAPVRHFKIQVPQNTGKEAAIVGEGIKEKLWTVDEKTGTGTWDIELHAPVMDTYDIHISMEEKIPEIQIGETRNINLPELVVPEVFNETGYISIIKSHTIELDDKPQNLESIDSKELPPSMDQTQSTLAFRYFSHPLSLALGCTKHDYEKVLSAIVTQAHFDIVVSEEGVAKTEALFLVKNTNRQSLEIVMPDGTEKIYSVLISGKKAGISKGSSEKTKIIMLPNDIESGRQFSIRIIYETRIKKLFGFAGSIKLNDAEIQDVPMLKTSWRLFLPKPYSYLYIDGTIHPDENYAGCFENINSGVNVENYTEQSRIELSAQSILKQQDEAAGVGMDVDIVREGMLYKFAKLDRDANLKVLYIKKTVMIPVSILILLVTVYIFITLAGRTSGSSSSFLIGSLLSAFVLKIFLPQGFKYFGWIIFWGIGCAGFIVALKLFKKVSPATPIINQVKNDE